jgi:HEAT repeat protein/GTPase SAR1 family protein
MFASGITVALVGVIAQRSLERYKQWLDKRRKHEEREIEEAKHTQSVEDGIKAYRERLKEDCCHLSISDLPNVPSSLNLESLYQRLQVREKESLYYPREEEMAVAWEPTEVLRLSQAHLAKSAIVLSPEDALAKFPRMAVLGDPGAGKTTMLSYLALKMAQETEPKLPYLPVYVKLGRFVDSAKDLLDFIADELDKRYGFPDRSYWEQLLDDGKAALLLDGLDEVAVEANPEEVKNPDKSLTHQIDQLATRFHKAPIVVTYRRAWRGVSNRFQPLEVLNFNWTQVQEFVKKWFESDPNKAEKLLEDLAGNLRMQTLAENPLILSLIAIVYGQDLKLPQRRAELYRRCAELLLQEWDDRRGVERFSQFKREDIQNLLIEVAWHFHCEKKPYFHKDDLLQLISDFLASSNIGIPLEKNKVVLDKITGSSSLLKESAHELYGFLHLTFQEYFAALAVKQATEQGDTTRLQEVIKQKHRHEPWREEVILLLAECMNDTTPLLLSILGYPLGQRLPEDINQLVPEGNPLAANDDLFDSDLLLAAHCLVSKPQIQVQGLRDHIITEVKNLLQTSPYKLDWDRAAQVLVEIGNTTLIDELLEMLIPIGRTELERQRDVAALMEKRFSIASACGQHGDQNVAERLLNLLERRVELDGQVLGRISYALAELRASNAVPQVLTMFNAATEQWTQIRLATALIELGEKSVVPQLMDTLIDEQCYESEKITILELIGNSGDKSVAPRLLQMLLAETTSTSIKPVIAQALRELKDSSLVSFMLEQLQDETLDWEIRWLLTESLEGLQESAITSLRKMLKNPNTDPRVRVGIAATLGTWGEPESINYLREAIEKQIVPPNWCLENSNWIGYVWRRITRTLKSLGDNSVLPSLVSALKETTDNWREEGGLSSWWFIRDSLNECVTSTTMYNASVCEAKGIIFAALEYDPDVIAQQVLGILRQQTSRLFQDELLRTLPKLATKSLLPELLRLLAERRTYTAHYKTWVSVVKAIGELADDRETVRALLAVGLSLSSQEESYLEPAIYQALYSVSRRARVRVGRDEQIEQLKTQTTH